MPYQKLFKKLPRIQPLNMDIMFNSQIKLNANKAYVATSRIAFLDINLNVLQVATSNLHN